jgi:hypothetical protein
MVHWRLTMAKSKNDTSMKMYDWMVSPKGDDLNGYGTEMCLKPVPVDPETGQRAIKKSGKHKGEPKSFTKDEFATGRIWITWLWPGHRIATLLKLLKLGLLTGRAAQDATALKTVAAGKTPSKSYADSEGWARDIIAQEDAKLKQLQKEAKPKKKLRAGSSNGKVHKGRPARKRSTARGEDGGKQESGSKGKGRPRSRVRGKPVDSGASKTRKRKDKEK